MSEKFINIKKPPSPQSPEGDTSHSILTIHKDAFSNGQIGCKALALQRINKYFHNSKLKLFGFLEVGLLSFLLLNRKQLNIKTIRSFDLDSKFEKQADLVNENWHWMNQKFKAKTIDCNYLDYTDLSFVNSEEPNLIINISVEHFSSIPFGKMLALQSCNMEHEDHVFCVHSEEEFKKQFPLTDIYYSGTLDFNYPNHSFTR